MKLGWVCLVERRTDNDPWKETYAYFTSGRKLWLYIEALAWDKKPLIVLAHNAFFDCTASGFYSHFGRSNYRVSFRYDKGTTYIFTIRNKGRTIKVLSTTNYFPASLKEMGKAVSLEKLEVDFANTTTEQLSTYCKRDTEILAKYMQQYIEFVKQKDLGRFGMTRASQAMNAFRHRFMDVPIYLHQDNDVRALETSAYFGGRTEAFRLGKIPGGPFTTLDINSMYPFIMANRKVPVRYRGTLEKPSIAKTKTILGRFACVAQVQLDTDSPIYAVRRKGKVIFPIGKVETYLCTGGLKEAIKRSHLKRVIKLAYYEQAVVFSRYVEYFYGMRQSAKLAKDNLSDTYAKYCLNSLYGKFGQYKPIVSEELLEDTEEYSRQEIFDHTQLKTIVVTKCMGVSSVEEGRSYAEKSFYAIPAHITEYARLLLWTIIESAGIDRALYCDTDSIKVRSKDTPKLAAFISPTKLGSLKIERVSDSLTIHGCKDYADGDQVKIKGIPKSAKQVGPQTYTYQTWLKQSSHLRLRSPDKYIIVNTTKTLSRVYDKGRVLSSGIVRPLRLKDW